MNAVQARLRARAKRVRAIWLGVGLLVLALLLTAGLWLLSARDKARAEYAALVERARAAARDDDLVAMRRLHLDDALLADRDLRAFFAPFATVTDETIADLEPNFEGDTYGWLRLPRAPVIYKILRHPDGWYLQGETAATPSW